MSMDTTQVIERMIAAGHHLAVDGDKLLVSQAKTLTAQQRTYIQAHKQDIIETLQQAQVTQALQAIAHATHIPLETLQAGRMNTAQWDSIGDLIHNHWQTLGFSAETLSAAIDKLDTLAH